MIDFRSAVFLNNIIDFYNEIKDSRRSLNNRTHIDLGDNLNNIGTVLNNFKSNTMSTIISSEYAYYAFLQWIYNE